MRKHLDCEQLESRCTPATLFQNGSSLIFVNLGADAHTVSIVHEGDGSGVGLMDQQPPVFFSGVNFFEWISFGGARDNLSYVLDKPRTILETQFWFLHGGAITQTIDNRAGEGNGGTLYVNEMRNFCGGTVNWLFGPVAANGYEDDAIFDNHSGGIVNISRVGEVDGYGKLEFYSNGSSVAYNATYDGILGSSGTLSMNYLGGSNSGPASMTLHVEAGSTGTMDCNLHGNYNGGDSLFIDFINDSGQKTLGEVALVTNRNNLGNVSITDNVQLSYY